MMALGSFLPWAQAGIFSLAGTSGDGVFTLIGGVIVVVLALVKKGGRVRAVVMMLISILGGFIAFNVYNNLDADSRGMGLYVAGLGALIGAVGSFGLLKVPAARRTTNEGPSSVL